MKKQLQLLMMLVSVWSYGQNPVYQFDFDGNMNNAVVNSNFGGWVSAGSGSVSYVNNRLGEAGKAVQIPNTLNFTASATSLPFGNQSRTLSFWAKFVNDNDTKTYPVIGWGNNTAGNAYGFWRNGVQNSYYTWGTGNDYNVPQTNAQIQASNNGWVHIAMTYSNTNNSFVIYYNGVDAGSYSRVLITNGSTLYLNRLVNSSSGTGDAIQVDDLKIYDTPLTATQIQGLYNPGASGSAPTVSNVFPSGTTPNSGTVFFTVNPGGNTTTTEITVTGFGAGIGSVFPGPIASGIGDQLLQYNIEGLSPGSCYTFNVRVVNSAGSQFSATRAFCTLDANFNKTPVYHFDFNGDTEDALDPDVSFQNPNSGFVDNNTALRLVNDVQSINLPYLQQGSAKRTVAIRLAFENGALTNNTNNVFSYGSATNNQSFGYNQETANQAAFYYWSNDVIFSNPITAGTYYTMVFVYNGMETKIYRDGVLVGTNSSFTPNTLGTLFRLGRTTTGVGGFFNGRVDDLRIYNDALNDTDVLNLSAALSSTAFETDDYGFTLYPNPASDHLSIASESELKSVEVYSLQGQMITTTTSNQINVSGLAQGMYLVKVTDVNDHTATQRLMVK